MTIKYVTDESELKAIEDAFAQQSSLEQEPEKAPVSPERGEGKPYDAKGDYEWGNVLEAGKSSAQQGLSEFASAGDIILDKAADAQDFLGNILDTPAQVENKGGLNKPRETSRYMRRQSEDLQKEANKFVPAVSSFGDLSFSNFIPAVAETIAQLPTFAAQYSNPVALGLTGIGRAKQVYDKQAEEDKSVLNAVGSTAAGIALDKFGLDKLTKGVFRPSQGIVGVGKNIAKATGAEAIAEGGQYFTGEYGVKGDLDDATLGQGLDQAALGAVLGGGTRGAFEAPRLASTVATKQGREEIAKALRLSDHFGGEPNQLQHLAAIQRETLVRAQDHMDAAKTPQEREVAQKELDFAHNNSGAMAGIDVLQELSDADVPMSSKGLRAKFAIGLNSSESGVGGTLADLVGMKDKSGRVGFYEGAEDVGLASGYLGENSADGRLEKIQDNGRKVLSNIHGKFIDVAVKYAAEAVQQKLVKQNLEAKGQLDSDQRAAYQQQIESLDRLSKDARLIAQNMKSDASDQSAIQDALVTEMGRMAKELRRLNPEFRVRDFDPGYEVNKFIIGHNALRKEYPSFSFGSPDSTSASLKSMEGNLKKAGRIAGLVTGGAMELVGGAGRGMAKLNRNEVKKSIDKASAFVKEAADKADALKALQDAQESTPSGEVEVVNPETSSVVTYTQDELDAAIVKAIEESKAAEAKAEEASATVSDLTMSQKISAEEPTQEVQEEITQEAPQEAPSAPDLIMSMNLSPEQQVAAEVVLEATKEVKTIEQEVEKELAVSEGADLNQVPSSNIYNQAKVNLQQAISNAEATGVTQEQVAKVVDLVMVPPTRVQEEVAEVTQEVTEETPIVEEVIKSPDLSITNPVSSTIEEEVAEVTQEVTEETPIVEEVIKSPDLSITNPISSTIEEEVADILDRLDPNTESKLEDKAPVDLTLSQNISAEQKVLVEDVKVAEQALEDAITEASSGVVVNDTEITTPTGEAEVVSAKAPDMSLVLGDPTVRQRAADLKSSVEALVNSGISEAQAYNVVSEAATKGSTFAEIAGQRISAIQEETSIDDAVKAFEEAQPVPEPLVVTEAPVRTPDIALAINPNFAPREVEFEVEPSQLTMSLANLAEQTAIDRTKNRLINDVTSYAKEKGMDQADSDLLDLIESMNPKTNPTKAVDEILSRRQEQLATETAGKVSEVSEGLQEVAQATADADKAKADVMWSNLDELAERNNVPAKFMKDAKEIHGTNKELTASQQVSLRRQIISQGNKVTSQTDTRTQATAEYIEQQDTIRGIAEELGLSQIEVDTILEDEFGTVEAPLSGAKIRSIVKSIRSTQRKKVENDLKLEQEVEKERYKNTLEQMADRQRREIKDAKDEKLLKEFLTKMEAKAEDNKGKLQEKLYKETLQRLADRQSRGEVDAKEAAAAKKVVDEAMVAHTRYRRSLREAAKKAEVVNKKALDKKAKEDVKVEKLATVADSFKAEADAIRSDAKARDAEIKEALKEAEGKLSSQIKELTKTPELANEVLDTVRTSMDAFSSKVVEAIEKLGKIATEKFGDKISKDNAQLVKAVSEYNKLTKTVIDRKKSNGNEFVKIPYRVDGATAPSTLFSEETDSLRDLMGQGEGTSYSGSLVKKLRAEAFGVSDSSEHQPLFKNKGEYEAAKRAQDKGLSTGAALLSEPSLMSELDFTDPDPKDPKPTSTKKKKVKVKPEVKAESISKTNTETEDEKRSRASKEKLNNHIESLRKESENRASSITSIREAKEVDPNWTGNELAEFHVEGKNGVVKRMVKLSNEVDKRVASGELPSEATMRVGMAAIDQLLKDFRSGFYDTNPVTGRVIKGDLDKGHIEGLVKRKEMLLTSLEDEVRSMEDKQSKSSKSTGISSGALSETSSNNKDISESKSDVSKSLDKNQLREILSRSISYGNSTKGIKNLSKIIASKRDNQVAASKAWDSGVQEYLNSNPKETTESDVVNAAVSAGVNKVMELSDKLESEKAAKKDTAKDSNKKSKENKDKALEDLGKAREEGDTLYDEMEKLIVGSGGLQYDKAYSKGLKGWNRTREINDYYTKRKTLSSKEYNAIKEELEGGVSQMKEAVVELKSKSSKRSSKSTGISSGALSEAFGSSNIDREEGVKSDLGETVSKEKSIDFVENTMTEEGHTSGIVEDGVLIQTFNPEEHDQYLEEGGNGTILRRRVLRDMILKGTLVVSATLVAGAAQASEGDDENSEDILKAIRKDYKDSTLIQMAALSQGIKEDEFNGIIPEFNKKVKEAKKENKANEAYNKKLGFKESTNRYDAENSLGYLGKYQWGSSALKDMGYIKKNAKGKNQRQILNNPENWTGRNGVTSKEKFLAGKPEQDTLINEWNKYLDTRIANTGVDKYVGRTMNGLEITHNGLRAAAHLLGPGGLRKVLKTGNLKSDNDAYGTTAYDYIKLMQNV